MSGFVRRLLCWAGRHSLYRYARVGYGTFQVRCRHCERRWGMNETVSSFLPWSDVAELYEGPDALFPEDGWMVMSPGVATSQPGIRAFADEPNHPTKA